MADRGRSLGAVLVALLAAVALLAGGCFDEDDPSADPAEPSDPPGEVAEPDASFDSEVVPSGDAVTVEWSLTNDGTVDLWVANRPPDPGESSFTASEENAYVVGRDDDTVEIGQRVFARPDTDVSFESDPRVGITRLRPGASLSGEVVVDRPFTRYHPYGDDLGDGTIELPDPATDVEFCLGVLPEPLGDQRVIVREEGETFTTHSGTADQYLYCSDPVDLS